MRKNLMIGKVMFKDVYKAKSKLAVKGGGGGGGSIRPILPM